MHKKLTKTRCPALLGNDRKAWQHHDENATGCASQGKPKGLLDPKNAIRDLEISGLKRELHSHRNLINMLLVLVDPEDVKAALELKQITPSNDDLLAFADKCKAPQVCLDDEDVRPW